MKKKKWLLNVLLVLFVLVFVGSGTYLLRYYLSAKNTEKALEELQEIKADSEQEDTGEEVVTEEGFSILSRYKKLYKKNSDLIGWIQVDDTVIDYPVMQTKKDNEYYLHKNFQKKYDVNGLPFLDSQCDMEDKESNLVIYGHHMKSGMMFAHLLDFQSKDFYKKHKNISLDTLYEKREYEVVAAFYSQIYEENTDAFKYYDYTGHLTEKQFDTYVENIRKLSLYDTGILPKYGESLLTLVTCAYHTENGRFVVVAKQKS
jgi:sortase B